MLRGDLARAGADGATLVRRAYDAYAEGERDRRRFVDLMRAWAVTS